MLQKKDAKSKKKEIAKKKSAVKVAAKPAPKPVVKPAPKPVVKPAPKPVAKPAPKPVSKVVDHSSNHNVRDAIKKLRTLKSRDAVMAFIKGEKRVTVTKTIPNVLKRLK